MAQFWLPGDSDFALAMREPNLLVPGKQPIGNYVPPNNALLFFDPRFGQYGRNLKDGLAGELYTGTVTSGADQHGWFQSGNNGILRVGDFVDIRGGYTITLDIALTSIDVSYGGTFVIPSDSGADSHFALQRAGAGTTFRLYHSTSYLQVSEITVAELTDGKRHILTICWDGSTILIFLDGTKRVESSFTAIPGYAGVMPGCYMFAARDLTTSYGSDGKCYAISINKYLGEQFAQEINRNIFLGCKSANNAPLMISVPAGGGAPTLSFPGVTGVQATQATPQVTLTF